MRRCVVDGAGLAREPAGIRKLVESVCVHMLRPAVSRQMCRVSHQIQLNTCYQRHMVRIGLPIRTSYVTAAFPGIFTAVM